MRPKLLKSFILVALFWFIVTTLYWSFADPKKNWESLQNLNSAIPFLNLPVPKEVSVMGALGVQAAVLQYWTLPVIVLSALSCLAGWGVMWGLGYRKHQERAGREKGTGNFRGVKLTLGALPVPATLPADELDLSSADSEALERLTEKEKKLLGDVLGVGSAHPDAFSGEGNGASLLEHMLNVSSKALERQRYPGMSAIVAAAHELGKITAWTKSESGDWVETKNQDREASKILTSLDSWWALDKESRLALMLAVKYHSNPRLLPDVDGEHRIYRLARDLLDNASEAQVEAVVEEKQKTLEKHELPDVLFDAFIRALPTLSFQSFGMPKNVPAVAWKVGNRVYMLEIKLRETVMAKLSQEVRGALTGTGKGDRSKLAPFTLQLLKSLETKGWLVREIGQMSLDTKEALWNIKAGKLEFKGVIVIDVPAEHLEMLPAQDSAYAVSVLGPLFQQPGSVAISKNDLLGDVLRPKAAPTVKTESDGSPV
jgi:hypothetical protein